MCKIHVNLLFIKPKKLANTIKEHVFVNFLLNDVLFNYGSYFKSIL